MLQCLALFACGWCDRVDCGFWVAVLLWLASCCDCWFDFEWWDGGCWFDFEWWVSSALRCSGIWLVLICLFCDVLGFGIW